MSPTFIQKKKPLLALVCFVASVVSGATFADSIAVPNFSFENPNTLSYTLGTAAGVDNSVMSDWTFTLPGASGFAYGVQLNTTAQFASASDGNQWAFINSDHGAASITNAASLATVTPDTNYTFTVALGKRADNNSVVNNAAITLSLLVNGSVVSFTNIAGTSLTSGQFTDQSFT